MHHPGFALLIWAIDIFGALLVLRFLFALWISIATIVRGYWRLGMTPRWVHYRESFLLLAWNFAGTALALALLFFLFGAPRWLKLL